MKTFLVAIATSALVIPALAGCATDGTSGSGSAPGGASQASTAPATTSTASSTPTPSTSGAPAQTPSAGGAGAPASTSGIPSLVNVNLQNVLNDLSVRLNIDRANVPVTAQLPIQLAANVCGVSVNVLSASLASGRGTCTATTAPQELAQVVQQQMAAGGSVGGGAQGGSTAATGGAPTSGTASGGATSTGGTSTGMTATQVRK